QHAGEQENAKRSRFHQYRAMGRWEWLRQYQFRHTRLSSDAKRQARGQEREPARLRDCQPRGSRWVAMRRVGPFLRPDCRMNPMQGRGELAACAAYIGFPREQNESKDLQCETTPIVSSDTVPDSLCSLFV